MTEKVALDAILQYKDLYFLFTAFYFHQEELIILLNLLIYMLIYLAQHLYYRSIFKDLYHKRWFSEESSSARKVL